MWNVLWESHKNKGHDIIIHWTENVGNEQQQQKIFLILFKAKWNEGKSTLVLLSVHEFLRQTKHTSKSCEILPPTPHIIFYNLHIWIIWISIYSCIQGSFKTLSVETMKTPKLQQQQQQQKKVKARTTNQPTNQSTNQKCCYGFWMILNVLRCRMTY